MSPQQITSSGSSPDDGPKSPQTEVRWTHDMHRNHLAASAVFSQGNRGSDMSLYQGEAG